MGGIYLYQWTCSKCEFEDETISSPFRVEAKSGVYKSLIEHRFCKECNGIRRCFTGKSATYFLSDLETTNNDILWRWRWKSRNEVLSRINELEIKKKRNL